MSTAEPPQARRALQAHRRAIGHTQASAADAVGVALNTYRSWEQGRNLPYPGHRLRLARALGVDLTQLALWLDGSDTTAAPAKRAVPKWLGTYAALEQGAARLQAYEAISVHGLLQTREYAAATARSMGRTEIDSFVQLRMRRQDALTRRGSRLHLSVVMDESVLHRQAGDGEIMADQLAHLVTLSSWDNVDLRLIPLTPRGVFPVGNFTLLTGPDDVEPFMVCVEDRGGVHYLDRAPDLAEHAHLYRYLSGVALAPDEAAELIDATIRGRYS